MPIAVLHAVPTAADLPPLPTSERRAGRRLHCSPSMRRPTCRRRAGTTERAPWCCAAGQLARRRRHSSFGEPGRAEGRVTHERRGPQALDFEIAAKEYARNTSRCEPTRSTCPPRTWRASNRSACESATALATFSDAAARRRSAAAARAGPALELLRPAALFQRPAAQPAQRHGHRRAHRHAYRGAGRRRAWSIPVTSSSTATRYPRPRPGPRDDVLPPERDRASSRASS